MIFKHHYIFLNDQNNIFSLALFAEIMGFFRLKFSKGIQKKGKLPVMENVSPYAQRCVKVISNWKGSVIRYLAVFVISGATSFTYKKYRCDA